MVIKQRTNQLTLDPCNLFTLHLEAISPTIYTII